MQINADLTKRAVVNSCELPWVDSPLPGVQRRMLERDGAEIARATSIVRYIPDSFFTPHTHDGGEEFLVLDGVFSDEMGDFHAGMYVRNPPGSRHQPFTKQGCTILVKLRQFMPGDQDYVRINTNITEWLPGRINGMFIMPLHEFGAEKVVLVKWRMGTRYAQRIPMQGDEIYVITGSLQDEEGIYPAGTWIRNPSGREHMLYSESGCMIYLKTGHL